MIEDNGENRAGKPDSEISASSTAELVDVALNVFAKPYQSALSVLSLLKASGKHIDRVYIQFEAYGSSYDHATPYAIAEYLGEKAVIFQPEHWLQRETVELAQLVDPELRLSIRYQHAFENSPKKYMFVMHNDVFILRDVIGAMRANIGDAFIIGGVGQCWNCPASNVEVLKACGLGESPCTPENYQDFKIDGKDLARLYAEARKRDIFVRPYDKDFGKNYAQSGWPLPECRVNEWACLINMEKTRGLVAPNGKILPFGAFEACGSVRLDTASSWFRDLNRAGLEAKHMDTAPYLKHWVGNNKTTPQKYAKAEDNAREILGKGFKDFVEWCKKKDNGMFTG